MNARTEGSWKVVRDGTVGLHTIWSSDEILLIARTCFAPSSEPNAYLIAAAPELLAALKAILAGFETGIFCRNTEGDHLSEWAIHAAPAIAALAVGQRAVAKAEGR